MKLVIKSIIMQNDSYRKDLVFFSCKDESVVTNRYTAEMILALIIAKLGYTLS